MASASEGPKSPESSATRVTPAGKRNRIDGPTNGSVWIDCVPLQGPAATDPVTTPEAVLPGPVSICTPWAA